MSEAFLPSRGARTLSQLLSISLTASLLPILMFASLITTSASASASLIVDANNATFSFVSRTKISGSGNGERSGDVQKFTSVATVSGIVIDAVVTTAIENLGNVSNELPKITGYDPGDTPAYLDLDVDATSGNDFYGFINLNFKFYEGGTYTGPGTGNRLTLNNLNVFSLDIDSGAQFSDFKGFQSFRYNNPTRLRFSGGPNTIPQNLDATSPFVRFLSGSGASGSNNIQDQVEVKYLAADDFDVRVGNAAPNGQAYFAIGFGAAPWPNATLVTANNPRNGAPLSSDTSKYVPTTGNVILNKSDFGNYSDPDSNPFTKLKVTALPTAGTLQFLNGSTWANVTVDSYLDVSDIESGGLRLVMNSTSGTTDSAFKFKVNDSLIDSVATYTLTLNVSPTPQIITFLNPGTKLVNTTVASNATSDSGLSVTLSSRTPGICTISNLNIVSTNVSGLCQVEAIQVGNSTFSAAPNVTQSFYFDANTAQTISFANPGNQPLSASSVTTVATASSTLTVSITSLTSSTCTVNGFVVTFVTIGTCTLRASQAGGAVGQTTYGPASPVSNSFLITGTSNRTVTFDSNHNNSTTTTQSVVSGTATALTANSFTRAGFTFAGWNTAANGSGTSYTDAQSVTFSNDTTLYAQWTANATIVVPDPVQTDQVIAITPKSGPQSSEVEISGVFNLKIVNITLNDTSLPGGSWKQTPNSVTLSIPATFTGLVSIQLYNGAVPILKKVDFIVTQQTQVVPPNAEEKPTINWPKPSDIVEGTPLSAIQLNATSSVKGRFEYQNSVGQLLAIGKQTLKARFIPEDSVRFKPVDVEVELLVLKAIDPKVKPIVTPSDTSKHESISNITNSAKLEIKSIGLGLKRVQIQNGVQVFVVPELTFSGNTSVLVTVVDLSQVKDVLVPVTILPLSPTGGVSIPTEFRVSTVTWNSSPNATGYEVMVAGVKVCETTMTTCKPTGLIGPKSAVQIIAKGNDGLNSKPAPAVYQSPATPILAAVKNFATASSRLSPVVKRELRAFANEVRAAGFTRLQVQGHTDIRGGVDNRVLSRNRANETVLFLQKLLPRVEFKIGFFASSKPAADNATAEGLAANRRTEIALW